MTASRLPEVLGAILALSLACSDQVAQCVSGNDCSPGFACSQGSCRSQCIDTYDCAADEICLRGACEACSTVACTTVGSPGDGPATDGSPDDGSPPADGAPGDGAGDDAGDRGPDEDCPGSSPCNDFNPCTHTDICVGGICQGTPYGCDDLEPCTVDTCDGSGGCTYENLGPTESCDDGDFCNGTDTCDGDGTCVHSGDPCANLVGNNNNDCSESCDEALDTCTANDPPGSNCNDGNSCTSGDSCNSSGACTGNGYSCPSNCTVWACNGSGGCYDTGQANPSRACAPSDTGNEPCYRANPTGTCCGCGCNGIRPTACNADCTAMVQSGSCSCGTNCMSLCGSAPCEWCDPSGNLMNCCAGEC